MTNGKVGRDRPAQRLGFGESGSDGAAGLLDLLAGGGTQALDLDGELAAQIAGTEDLDGVAIAIDEAFLTKGGFVDDGTVVEGVEIADVDGFVHVTELDVGETFLGETTEKGHLAAFEAWADAATGAGHLTFVSFAGGLAVTGAFAAANTLFAFNCTGARLGIVETHGRSEIGDLKWEILEGFVLFDFLATSAEDLITRTKCGECGESGFYDIGVIAGAKGLADDVFNASSFEHSTCTTASDDTCTRGGRLQHDVTTTMFADDFMRDGIVVEMNKVHLLT